MAHFHESIAQCVWPKERVSTRLCAKCGDSFDLDLHELKYDEMMRRVRSGYSPAGLEHAFHSKLLADAHEEMDLCQTEIRRLQDLSRAIEAQKKLIGSYIAGIRCIISPIRSLPVELLGEIFKYVCCGDIGVNCMGDDDDQLPTLTLSRVCIRWYDLVTSMPVLWSSFGSRALDHPFTSSLFNLFLERSRLHLIDFKLHCMNSDLTAHSFSSLTIFENSNRWRHVHITARDSFVEEILQSLIDSGKSLPGLLSLILESSINIEILFSRPPELFYTVRTFSFSR
ncbi:hypothetical protein BT96DRAFT_460409 [Gymnopus androsaceus JB14]|uniref:Uncharacterized protein n=1 Tax=Gymnopus androsaceus JB14 TaxID=1447944 RepID=A0A6A4ICL3_9AGAR|nr:hypothetical protein BT96DRAFT_460409 [Gymnopus androsaceus JB14]